jgi:hypothetical protein
VISGAVASTGAPEAPMLVLRFVAIATPSDVSELHVRVVSAQHERYIATHLPPGQESALVHYQSMPDTDQIAIAEGRTSSVGMPILLPAGARLHLALTQPLAAGVRRRNADEVPR